MASSYWISSVEATSTLADKQDRYNKSYLTDGTLQPWCEGKPGDGIGEAITLNFKEPVQFWAIYISNGYHHGKYFALNNRIKGLEILSNGKPISTVELRDEPGAQLVRLGPDGKSGDSKVITTTAITLRILSVYPGKKDRDTCITEIGFDQILIKSTGGASTESAKPECYKFGDECVDSARWSDFLGIWSGGSVTTARESEAITLSINADQTCSWSSSVDGNHSCRWEPERNEKSVGGVMIMLNFSGSGPGTKQMDCDKAGDQGKNLACSIYFFDRK